MLRQGSPRLPHHKHTRVDAQSAHSDVAHTTMASLKSEIEQQRPFSSLEEEALLNLLRTSDALEREVQHRTRAWGVTSTQYNVLRILRGAQPRGLTCAAIGSRILITAEPDITRLLSRLKALKLIRQHRDRQDGRWCGRKSHQPAWSCCAPWTPRSSAVPGNCSATLPLPSSAT